MISNSSNAMLDSTTDHTPIRPVNNVWRRMLSSTHEMYVSKRGFSMGSREPVARRFRGALADSSDVHQTRLAVPPRPLTLNGKSLATVGKVRIYVCGITPYDVTHLGHATTYVWADLADRVLQWQGHAVSVARNVTDIDEVLFAEARRRNEPYDMLGAKQRAAFEATMATLRVRTPDHQPTAAQTVGLVIQLAVALLDNDKAYERNGTVYARTGAIAYLKANLSRDRAIDLATEYRDDPQDPAKEDPLDVVVWQNTAGREDADISWPSPWGNGRPGWHAECTAMVLALYGSGLDLHCGGADLEFPHHACEASLGELATGVTPFSRAWLRPGMVSLDGVKMSKSLKNLVLVEDLLKDYSPAAIRLLCLNRHWNEPWDYTRDALEESAATLHELYAAAGRKGQGTATIAAALVNNLDVPHAVQFALVEGGAAARTLIDVLALS